MIQTPFTTLTHSRATTQRSQRAQQRRLTGARGEDLAATYLRDHGWTILDRNWRPRGTPGLRGELDIIATTPTQHSHAPLLVAVEVKTRRTASAGTPADAVHTTKLARLTRLATAWAASHDVAHHALRLDVISILLRDPRPALLTHHRGVWQ